MHQRLIYFVASISLIACKPRVKTLVYEYADQYDSDTCQIEIYSHKKANTKALLFLPPLRDSGEFVKSPLFYAIYKKGYTILIPRKPSAKGIHFYSRKSLDTKDYYLNNIYKGIEELKKNALLDSNASLKYLAWDEGAHLLPELTLLVPADTCIYLNFSPLGRIYSLEKVSRKLDSLDTRQKKFLHYYTQLDSLKLLSQELKNIQNGNSDQFTIANQTASYWKSYNQSFLTIYQSQKSQNIWVNYLKYPLQNPEDRSLLKTYDHLRGKKSHFIRIDNYGFFMKEEDWEELRDTILYLFD